MKDRTNSCAFSVKRINRSHTHYQLLLAELLIVVFSSLPITNSLFISLPLSAMNTSFIHRAWPKSTLPSVSSTNTLNMSLRAWTCHGKNQRDMVDKLASAEAGIIKSAPVKEALSRVDRSNYVENPVTAYMDAPQSIGYGQTISAPHMHSHALEEILPSLTKITRELQQMQIMSEGENGSTKTNNLNEDMELKILDVGCGSGYLSAAFGRLVDRGLQGPIHPLSKGHVWGIDVVPELVTLSRNNIMKADKDLLDSETVTIMRGDGWSGLPSKAPFHAIHVGAAAESFPTSLMMQLYPKGGVMVIPVGPDGGIQNLYKIERLRDNNQFREEDFNVRALLGVRYVPLIHEKKP